MKTLLLKLFKSKKRSEIRQGKLWEITSVFGRDVLEVEQVIEAPQAFKRPEAMNVEAIRVHVILPENNVNNLTKNPELL